MQSIITWKSVNMRTTEKNLPEENRRVMFMHDECIVMGDITKINDKLHIAENSWHKYKPIKSGLLWCYLEDVEMSNTQPEPLAVSAEIKKLHFKGWATFSDRLSELHNFLSLTVFLDSDNLSAITAKIMWCYSSSSGFKQTFEFSEQGYNAACEFIQDKFEQMISELAAGNESDCKRESDYKH